MSNNIKDQIVDYELSKQQTIETTLSRMEFMVSELDTTESTNNKILAKLLDDTVKSLRLLND